MSAQSMRIAVIWSRFGPYHIARLRGVADVAAAEGVELHGIEVAQQDAVYAWDAVGKSEGFAHVTLFEGQSYANLSKRVIRAKMMATLDAISPDVVAVNGWSVAEARAALAWCDGGRRARAIVMSETKADDAPRVWWKELVKRRMLSSCNAALVGGAAHADYLVALGMPRERIAFGYDVIDNDHFDRGAAAARADASRLRLRHGLPQHYFFACTRFIKRKNVEGLLRAYATYLRRSPGAPWGLVIAGSGEETRAYDTLIGRLGIENVIWPGFVQYGELPVYYGLAGAFVHPAHAEAWGLVVNEALASGLPVVLSRSVGASGELLREGCNGFGFEPASDDELADRLLEMAVMSKTRREEMRLAARQTAAHWTPQRFGRELMALASMPAAPARGQGQRVSTVAGIQPRHTIGEVGR